MVVDAVARRPFEVADDVAQASVGDITAAATPRAHDVVVVGRLARDVRMVAARQVEPLHRAKTGEDVKRAEDRGPPDPEPPRARLGHQVRRGEMGGLIGDQPGDGLSGLRQAIPVTLKGDEEWIGIDHAWTIAADGLLVETESQIDGVVARTAPAGPSSGWNPLQGRAD